MPAYKLQGKTAFQGIPISIEHKKGSYRSWKNSNDNTSGKTLMHHDYGYIRGTTGLDSDAVDVYVGPDDTATNVYIVTQMKAPDFTKVDEQKCMLGFSSAAEAKKAYLKQYNNPKFFGSMKELDITSFKEKLKSNKGKLIKSVISDIMMDEYRIKGDDTLSKSGNDILKAMQVMVAKYTPVVTKHPMVLRKPVPVAYTVVDSTMSVEPPKVPMERVTAPEAMYKASSMDTACVVCGTLSKSLEGSCVRCNAAMAITEAGPLWSR